MREMLADLQRRGLIQQRSPATSDEECLADMERRNADGYGEPGDIERLIARVRVLTAERDALLRRLAEFDGRAARWQRACDIRDEREAQLTAERDALIVERDAWKIRVTG